MPNVKNIISAHNKIILDEDAKQHGTQENAIAAKKTTGHSKENANQRGIEESWRNEL